MDVGREIRRLREEKQWSQAKLAGEAHMGVSSVSQIETGVRNPSAATLWKIAEALGVEAADLFPKAQAPLPLENERELQRGTPAGPNLPFDVDGRIRAIIESERPETPRQLRDALDELLPRWIADLTPPDLRRWEERLLEQFRRLRDRGLTLRRQEVDQLLVVWEAARAVQLALQQLEEEQATHEQVRSTSA